MVIACNFNRFCITTSFIMLHWSHIFFRELLRSPRSLQKQEKFWAGSHRLLDHRSAVWDFGRRLLIPTRLLSGDKLCSLTVTGVGFYMLYFWLSDGNKTERCCTSDTFHRPRSFNLHFFLFLIMMPYFFQAPLHKLLPPFSFCQRFWDSCLNLNLASRWNTPRRVWAQRRASWQSAQRWLNMSKISKLIQIDVSCLLPSSMDQILKSVT